MLWRSVWVAASLVFELSSVQGQWNQPPSESRSVGWDSSHGGSVPYPSRNVESLETGPNILTDPWANHQPNSQSTWLGAFRQPGNCMGIQLGVLGLVRERPDSQVLALDENSLPLLNARDMQGSMQFGMEALIDFNNVQPWLGGTDIQFGYFGINSLDAEQSIAAPEVNAVFFNTLPITPPTDSIFLSSTNLYSGEANLRFLSTSRIRPLVGLRFLKVEDQYDVYQYSSGMQVGGYSKTNNHLFGGQFGAEADIMRFGQTRVYANGKFGTMLNQVDGSARAADATGAGVEKYFGDQHFSTLVDAGTGLDIGLGGPLSLRVGYRFLMASALAVGLDQNNSMFLLSPGETVVFNSQQWHGLDLAATLSF